MERPLALHQAVQMHPEGAHPEERHGATLHRHEGHIVPASRDRIGLVTPARQLARLAQHQQDLVHRRCAAVEVGEPFGEQHGPIGRLEDPREVGQPAGELRTHAAHRPAGDDEGEIGVRVPALAGPNTLQKAHAAAFSEVRTKRTS
jgi:hypothetical protein